MGDLQAGWGRRAAGRWGVGVGWGWGKLASAQSSGWTIRNSEGRLMCRVGRKGVAAGPAQGSALRPAGRPAGGRGEGGIICLYMFISCAYNQSDMHKI